MKNNYKETKHDCKDTTNDHRDTKSNKDTQSGSKETQDGDDVDDIDDVDDDVDVDDDDDDEGGFSLSLLPVCPETVNLLGVKRLLTTERHAAVFFCVVALEKLCRRNKQLRLSVRVISLCSVSLSGDWTITTETENTRMFSHCVLTSLLYFIGAVFSFDKGVGALWTHEHFDFIFFISGSKTNQTERNRQRKQSQSTWPESKHENLSVLKLNLN